MTDYRDKLSQNLYYILIFMQSVIALFVAPMFGSNLGISFSIPTTKAGWCVYVVTKLFVATINVLLFHCFVRQAKLNVKDDARYLEAQELMGKLNHDIKHPRSPKQYFAQLYSRKGTMIFVTSLLSAVVLTNAVLTFDLTSLVTYAITVTMGLILGVIKMKDVECFWTEEYLYYAREQYALHTANVPDTAIHTKPVSPATKEE